MTDPGSLSEVRARIDAIDADPIRLLADRQSLVRAAAAFKADEQAVRAPDRVAKVVAMARERATAAGFQKTPHGNRLARIVNGMARIVNDFRSTPPHREHMAGTCSGHCPPGGLVAGGRPAGCTAPQPGVRK